MSGKEASGSSKGSWWQILLLLLLIEASLIGMDFVDARWPTLGLLIDIVLAAGFSVSLVVGTYRLFRGGSQYTPGMLASRLLLGIGLLVLLAMVLRKEVTQPASILRPR